MGIPLFQGSIPQSITSLLVLNLLSFKRIHIFIFLHCNCVGGGRQIYAFQCPPPCPHTVCPNSMHRCFIFSSNSKYVLHPNLTIDTSLCFFFLILFVSLACTAPP